jgi:hypothetical protein
MVARAVDHPGFQSPYAPTRAIKKTAQPILSTASKLAATSTVQLPRQTPRACNPALQMLVACRAPRELASQARRLRRCLRD